MIKWTQGEWGQQSKGAYVPPTGEFEGEERPTSKRSNIDETKQFGGSSRHDVSERPLSATSFGRHESSSYAESNSNKRSFSDISSTGDRFNDSSFRKGGPRRSTRLEDDEDRRNLKSATRAGSSYESSRDPPKGNTRDQGRDGDERGNRERDWERTSNQDTFREPPSRDSSRDRGWNNASSRTPAAELSRRPATPEQRDFRNTNTEREWRDSSRDRNVVSSHSVSRPSNSFSNSNTFHDRTPTSYSSRSRSKNRPGSPASHQQISRDSRDVPTHSKGITNSSRSDVVRSTGSFDSRDRNARGSDDLRNSAIPSRNSDVFNSRPRTPPRSTEEFPKPRRLGTFPDSAPARPVDHQNDHRDRRPLHDTGGLEGHRDSRGPARNLDGNSRSQRDLNHKPVLDSTNRTKAGSSYQTKGRGGCSSNGSSARTQRSLSQHDDKSSQRTSERMSSNTSRPISGGSQAITRDGKAPIIKRTLGFKKRIGLNSSNQSSQGNLPSRSYSNQNSNISNERRGDHEDIPEDRKRPPQVVRRPQVIRKRQLITPSSHRSERQTPRSFESSHRDQAISRTSTNSDKRSHISSENNLVDSKLSIHSPALRLLESSDLSLSDRGAAAFSFLDSLLSSSQPDVAPAKSAAVLFLQSLSLSLLAEDNKIQENLSHQHTGTPYSENSVFVAEIGMSDANGTDARSLSSASLKDGAEQAILEQPQVRENGSMELTA